MNRNRFLWLLVLLVFAGACASGEVSPDGGDVGREDRVEDSSSSGQEAAPTQTMVPSATPDAFAGAVLRIVGEEEVVYDWSRDRCMSENIADLPARAYRNADGQVHLVISHPDSFVMVGPDLNNVTLDCEPISRSIHAADPSLYSDNEWIAAPYTEDGIMVYSLIHHEYQGHTHPGQCPSGEYIKCWYNSITMMVSQDGGRHFEWIAEPPGHFVAGLPYAYEPDHGVSGLFGPSNIVKGPDGYYYSLMKHQSYTTQQQTVCLMRTDDLSDPSSWRFWDSQAFEGQFVNPFQIEIASPSEHICAPIDYESIGAQMIESLTYNTFLERYVLVGLSADHLEGREVWGFYYSFSFDLIHWTRRQLLVEMPLPWTVAHHSNTNYLYPSLLDPESLSLSFETTGKTAFLYYTRNNFGHSSLDRDLIRVKVEFFPSAAEAP